MSPVPSDSARVVTVDTEFSGSRESERHNTVALVAHALDGDRPVQELRLFEDDLRGLRRNPLPRGPDVLWVAFVARLVDVQGSPLKGQRPLGGRPDAQADSLARNRSA